MNIFQGANLISLVYTHKEISDIIGYTTLSTRYTVIDTSGSLMITYLGY